jgi:serine/threonine protein kinase
LKIKLILIKEGDDDREKIQKNFNDYILFELLGKGTFGTVYLA